MTERPDVSQAQAAPDNAAANAPVSEADAEQRIDPLALVSEAAAERAVRDAEGGDDASALAGELVAAKAEAAELRDKWLRLSAEFDNFRKRNAKERMELTLFAQENVIKNLLPVLDDMERAIANNAKTDDVAAVREGFRLIQSKLLHILGSQGARPMADARGEAFDTDRHEAFAKAPAPSDDLKGKVVDVVENGYTLHDKVIRYAKVVVGE